MGDLEAAAECYQAVISSEPNDLDSRLALAEVYERLDDRERALELVNEGGPRRQLAGLMCLTTFRALLMACTILSALLCSVSSPRTASQSSSSRSR